MIFCGLVFSIAFGSITGATRSRLSADFNSMGAVVRMFKVHAGRYPTTKEGLRALIERPAGLPEGRTWVRLLDEVPRDPWQNPYGYVAGSEYPSGFGFICYGPDAIPSNDDILSWDESTDPEQRARKERRWYWLGAGLLIALIAFAWFGPDRVAAVFRRQSWSPTER